MLIFIFIVIIDYTNLLFKKIISKMQPCFDSKMGRIYISDIYIKIRYCVLQRNIIAICKMLLTAIWNILSKLEPYSAAGYIADRLTEHSVVITKAQGLELLRKRGYIFKDDLAADSA